MPQNVTRALDAMDLTDGMDIHGRTQAKKTMQFKI